MHSTVIGPVVFRIAENSKPFQLSVMVGGNLLQLLNLLMFPATEFGHL